MQQARAVKVPTLLETTGTANVCHFHGNFVRNVLISLPGRDL